MKTIDISRMIDTGALVYPGDDRIELSVICDISPDCPCRITALGGWTTHFLTHVDAPRHFVETGATLDQLPLERFSGRARVIPVERSCIDRELVQSLHISEGENVLFRSRHSGPLGDVFDESHVYITAEAAQALVDVGVNMVGVDYLSVDRFGDDEYPAHRTLLGAGVVILEALDLQHAVPGFYEVIALPLKIQGADGSPVRAVLRSEAI